jgi:protein-tyrosine-phosphatase
MSPKSMNPAPVRVLFVCLGNICRSPTAHGVFQAPLDYAGHMGLLLDFADAGDGREVPDPYQGGSAGFEQVLDLVEAACEGLLREILRREAG